MILAILFLSHFLADFVLQPRSMGEQKSNKFIILFLHCFIQWIMFLVMMSIWQPDKALAVASVNAIIHGVIDWNIWKLYKYSVAIRNRGVDRDELKRTWKYWEDHLFYVTIGLDQLLHALTLISIYLYLLS